MNQTQNNKVTWTIEHSRAYWCQLIQAGKLSIKEWIWWRNLAYQAGLFDDDPDFERKSRIQSRKNRHRIICALRAGKLDKEIKIMEGRNVKLKINN